MINFSIVDDETNEDVSEDVYDFVMPKWTRKASFGNSLNDCYQFYTKKPPLKKETRDIFVKGYLDEVVHDFQKLMAYCAQDVRATHEVFVKVFQKFRSHCQVSFLIFFLILTEKTVYYIQGDVSCLALII